MGQRFTKRRVFTIAANLLVAAVYFCSGKLGLKLAFVNVSASPVWPPTGISLAVVLLLGRGMAPGIFLGAFLVNIDTAGSITTSLGIAVGNTLEALLGAALVTRFAGGRNPFDRLRDVFVFMLVAALISTLISATIGVTTLAAAGLAPDYGSVWLTWWLGDAVSAAVIAPLILIWVTKPLPRWNREWLEAACLLAVVFLASRIVFGQNTRFAERHYPLEYLEVPPLLWAAFRFRQHGAVTVVLLMSSFAIRATFRGWGPFATGDPNESLLLVQAFIGTITMIGLALAAVVTEQERIEQSLRQSRADAERASKAKDEFLAVLSHELRTPLTPVLLTVSLLEARNDLPADVRQDTAVIRRNIELESRLIGDLLDLARVERGKFELDLHEVDVHALILAAADICRRENGPELRIELAATAHRVVGDSARLQQVFWNLISNAQKFTPREGRITVRSVDAGNRIRIEVEDNGVGIDPAILPRIFTAFDQGDNRQARQFGGLGLGLAISKKLVDAQGGTIAASSRGKGYGTTFIVELPAVANRADSGTVASTESSSRANTAMRILLVEDHEPTLTVLSKLLLRCGHQIVTASTFAAAVEALRQQKFDLLISDLGLPDGSGLELMRQLRDQYGGRGIALTGYGMSDDVRKSREAGFSAHLTKPVDLSMLQTTIDQITTG